MFSKTLRYIIFNYILLVSIFAGCSPDAETIEPIPGTIYETPISISYPVPPIELCLVSEIPGMMRLIGYSGSDFLTGTVEVSNYEWVPKTERSDSKVTLVQRAKTKVIGSQDPKNQWKLRIGDKKPFRLEIYNEQAEGHWNLSGLPITDLYTELGTAKNAFTFDEINPTIMQKCELHCGIGDVVVEGILNAACQNMVIEAREGNLRLRFSGKGILQDLKVSIHTGTGVVNIALLQEIPARITITSRDKIILGEGIIKLDSTDRRNTYQTVSYRSTSDKTIDIFISGGSGIIYLNSSP